MWARDLACAVLMQALSDAHGKARRPQRQALIAWSKSAACRFWCATAGIDYERFRDAIIGTGVEADDERAAVLHGIFRNWRSITSSDDGISKDNQAPTDDPTVTNE